MLASVRGRAVITRARRSVSWAALGALWALQMSGALQAASAWPERAAGPAGEPVIRAGVIDEILEEIFGDKDEPEDPAPGDPAPSDPSDEGEW